MDQRDGGFTACTVDTAYSGHCSYIRRNFCNKVSIDLSCHYNRLALYIREYYKRSLLYLCITFVMVMVGVN